MASYGLKFELGDTLKDLARRNERMAVLQSLEPKRFEVAVCNAMTGSELCRLPADIWTLQAVAQEVGFRPCFKAWKGMERSSWRTYST